VSGNRRDARERALALLYEAETRAITPQAVLDSLPIKPDAYTAVLVAGVEEQLGAIDEQIRTFAKGWNLERMPALDRAVLRLSIYELLSQPEVPTGVVIAEAVFLASAYSTDESGPFVNGLLSRIAKDVRGSLSDNV